jgi:hypothetical protein
MSSSSRVTAAVLSRVIADDEATAVAEVDLEEGRSLEFVVRTSVTFEKTEGSCSSIEGR